MTNIAPTNTNALLESATPMPKGYTGILAMDYDGTATFCVVGHDLPPMFWDHSVEKWRRLFNSEITQ